MKKTVSLLLSSLLLLSLVTMATSCRQTAPSHEELSVVATNFALYDFARAVCGSNAEVSMLLKPGNESHDYEVTVEDIAAISGSDLFIYVGGESEDWVGDVFNSMGDLSNGIEKISAISCVRAYIEETPEGSFEEEEDTAGYDEHVWTSIENAVILINRIRDEMVRIDPAHSSEYTDNAGSYTSLLGSLSDDYKDTVNNAMRKTIVVADRFPFRYLSEEYGLEYYAAFSGCTSATEPSLSTVSYLTDIVKENNIRYIFTIEFSDRKTAGAIASETGAQILTLHSAHNVSKSDFNSGITYYDIMKSNLEALRLALN